MTSAFQRAAAIGAVVLTAAAVVALPALAAHGQHTAAGNRRAAGRDAAQLVLRVRLPHRAKSSASNPGRRQHVLGGSGLKQGGTKTVDAHAWWTVHEPFPDVLGYVQTHRPRGARLVMSGGGGSGPPWEFVVFSFPSQPGVLGYRWLEVTMVQLSRRLTGVRVDGVVEWIIPRPRSEKVPAGVQTIDVVKRSPGQPPAVSRVVRQKTAVERLIRLVDGLPTVQPVDIACPSSPSNAPMVNFTFRGDHGQALARASMLAYDETATACNDMSFMIGARHETPLLAGGRFLHRVGRVIGVSLAVPPGS